MTTPVIEIKLPLFLTAWYLVVIHDSHRGGSRWWYGRLKYAGIRWHACLTGNTSRITCADGKTIFCDLFVFAKWLMQIVTHCVLAPVILRISATWPAWLFSLNFAYSQSWWVEGSHQGDSEVSSFNPYCLWDKLSCWSCGKWSVWISFKTVTRRRDNARAEGKCCSKVGAPWARWDFLRCYSRRQQRCLLTDISVPAQCSGEVSLCTAQKCWLCVQPACDLVLSSPDLIVTQSATAVGEAFLDCRLAAHNVLHNFAEESFSFSQKCCETQLCSLIYKDQKRKFLFILASSVR